MRPRRVKARGADRAIVGGRVNRCPANATFSGLPRRLPRQLHHLQQHRFAGIDQFFQRDAVRCALALRGAAAREQRHMDEGGEAGAVVAVDVASIARQLR